MERELVTRTHDSPRRGRKVFGFRARFNRAVLRAAASSVRAAFSATRIDRDRNSLRKSDVTGHYCAPPGRIVRFREKFYRGSTDICDIV